MGFSPKILVALIVLGLVATGSIVFNVYLLATKDTFRTEVEGLKESKTKLDKDLSDLKLENKDFKDKVAILTGGKPNEEGIAQNNIVTLEELIKIKDQNEKLKVDKTRLKKDLRDLKVEYNRFKDELTSGERERIN